MQGLRWMTVLIFVSAPLFGGKEEEGRLKEATKWSAPALCPV